MFSINKRDKKRFSIGYLDENAYTEHPGYITAGIFEAARNNNLNIIRFGHFDTHNYHSNASLVEMVLEHIQQYDLDGLMFLGWARVATQDYHESFKKRFSSVPLFSVGSGFPDIPNTFFPGDLYVIEIIEHLITVHGYKKIAFIAPYWPDNRSAAYTDTMKKYGIYNPGLYVSEKDLIELEAFERGKRIASILLDERRLEVEAIVSLSNDETKGLIQELNRRGLNVPEDVAVTSYEDGEIGRFSSPSLTTVYFPFREIGFHSCEKMYELLATGHVNKSNLVPGRVIVRESCGCMPSSVIRSAAGQVTAAEKAFENVTELDLIKLEKELCKEIYYRNLDIEALLYAFQNNFKRMGSNLFLNELAAQLERIEYRQCLPEVEDFVSILRKVLLPCFIPYIESNMKTYLWAEDLFQQAQVLLLDRKSSAWAREEVQSKSNNLVLQEISQKLVDNFSMDNLMDSLEAKLPALNIPSCYIFIFKNPEENENPFDHSVLAFEYSNHKRIKSKITTCKASQKLSGILFPEDRPYMMMANLLYVGDEVIGFALFEPGPVDERIYHTLAIHISTALHGVILLEKLDSSYKRLVEQAHRKGMADVTSGILHNVGNILNSINVSIHMIKGLANTSPVKDFLSANSLLEKNIGCIEDFILSQEKGRKLLRFYIKLEVPMSDFRAQILNNVNRLIYNINIINEIVSAQDSYTGIKLSMEEADLVAVVEDALKMNLVSLEKRNINIVRDYGCNPAKSTVQKAKLFHILVNIINNAKDAMLEVPENSRTLTVSVSQDSQHKYISISDTGCGIRPELLESIFAYGYTTKKDGHGFGLHSCANYMAEMGGRIWAESEGKGKGARFVLQFKN